MAALDAGEELTCHVPNLPLAELLGVTGLLPNEHLGGHAGKLALREGFAGQLLLELEGRGVQLAFLALLLQALQRLRFLKFLDILHIVLQRVDFALMAGLDDLGVLG